MPNDDDFPDECEDEDPENPCPDPDRDRDTLTDVLDVLDGVGLELVSGTHTLSPFRLDVGATKVDIDSGRYLYTGTVDGIAFSVGETEHSIEWGHHSGGTRWHTRRVSFDREPLRTVKASE